MISFHVRKESSEDDSASFLGETDINPKDATTTCGLHGSAGSIRTTGDAAGSVWLDTSAFPVTCLDEFDTDALTRAQSTEYNSAESLSVGFGLPRAIGVPGDDATTSLAPTSIGFMDCSVFAGALAEDTLSLQLYYQMDSVNTGIPSQYTPPRVSPVDDIDLLLMLTINSPCFIC